MSEGQYVRLEVRERSPGYWTWDVALAKPGMLHAGIHSGGVRSERDAERFAAEAVDVLQARFDALGLARLPVVRIGPGPRARRAARGARFVGAACGLGCALAAGAVVFGALAALGWRAVSAIW